MLLVITWNLRPEILVLVMLDFARMFINLEIMLHFIINLVILKLIVNRILDMLTVHHLVPQDG